MPHVGPEEWLYLMTIKSWPEPNTKLTEPQRYPCTIHKAILESIYFRQKDNCKYVPFEFEILKKKELCKKQNKTKPQKNPNKTKSKTKTENKT